MITITNLGQTFTGRTLFEGVSLNVFPNEKIGLTGPNGGGKSTLFALILGRRQPTEGRVTMRKGLQIGHLPQEARFASGRTVMEEVTSGDARIAALLDEKAELESSGRAGTTRYGDVLDALEHLGVYALEHRAEKVLAGLGFAPTDLHRPVRELSGGWQMRVLLGRLLICPYDILLLDEPTNHLDLPATLWLKDFLKAYDGTFMVISHDKVFLNAVTNETIVLENGRMTKVKGNYEAYERQKAVLRKTLERRQKVVEQRRRQLERFTQRFHAQPNRAAAVRNKRKMLERLEEVSLPEEVRSIRDFTIRCPSRSGYVVARCEHVTKVYGDRRVYEDLDWEITRGQKICLVGPNGAGKSTLLKMLAGVVPPDRGRIVLGPNVRRGYFSQTRMDVLQPNLSVMDELARGLSGSYPVREMRTLLGVFNFHGEDVFKPVCVLSGGEKSRLILAKLLLSPPNFILLDEPTTHLDVDGVEALTAALRRYDGTLCFISHDLYFVQELAETIVAVETGGRLRVYPGGLDYYLQKKEGDVESSMRGETRPRSKASSGPRNPRRRDEDERLRRLREAHRAALRRLSEIRDRIRELETECRELETESYVKSRVLANAYGKDPDLLKEYGRRLKEIPVRLRDVKSEIKALEEERRRIQK